MTVSQIVEFRSTLGPLVIKRKENTSAHEIILSTVYILPSRVKSISDYKKNIIFFIVAFVAVEKNKNPPGMLKASQS
jgi:hypothetical protein